MWHGCASRHGGASLVLVVWSSFGRSANTAAIVPGLCRFLTRALGQLYDEQHLTARNSPLPTCTFFVSGGPAKTWMSFAEQQSCNQGAVSEANSDISGTSQQQSFSGGPEPWVTTHASLCACDLITDQPKP